MLLLGEGNYADELVSARRLPETQKLVKDATPQRNVWNPASFYNIRRKKTHPFFQPRHAHVQNVRAPKYTQHQQRGDILIHGLKRAALLHQ